MKYKDKGFQKQFQKHNIIPILEKQEKKAGSITHEERVIWARIKKIEKRKKLLKQKKESGLWKQRRK